MTVVVVDAKAELAHLNGEKHAQPPEVVADNARQQAKADAKAGKAPKEVPKEPVQPVVAAAEDETEDESGLTAAERAEFTERMRKTIGKKHGQMKEAQEKAKESEALAEDQYNQRVLAERRAQNLERELARVKGAEPAQEVKVAEKPDRKSFETDDAFQDALVDWKVDQRIQAKATEDAAKAVEAERVATRQACMTRVAAAQALVPDFNEVCGNTDVSLPEVVVGYMERSDMVAELSYHFAKHPDVAAKLLKLQPAVALVEIGKIESKLQPFAPVTDAAKVAKTPPSEVSPTESALPGSGPSKSRDAPVIQPLGSGSASQVQKPENEKSYSEVREDWAKKNRVNFSARKRH